jgi:NAD dependent epimerase/dehydratase family enzyme
MQVVLEGQRVLPAHAQEDGYRFKYGSVQDALRSVVRQ